MNDGIQLTTDNSDHFTEKKKNSRVPIEVKYVCELPVFEPGYNFEESGNSTINAASDWDAVLTFSGCTKSLRH